MDRKKVNTVIILLMSLLIVSTLFLYNHQQKVVQKSMMRLEVVVGSALYKIWDNYNAIIIRKNEEVGIDYVVNVYQQLLVIEAYSDSVDRAVSKELLKPISKNFILLIESIVDSYEEEKSFTEEAKSKYMTLITKIEELIPLIYSVYYIPESQEGAQVSIEINEYQEMVEFNKRLKSYVSSFN